MDSIKCNIAERETHWDANDPIRFYLLVNHASQLEHPLFIHVNLWHLQKSLALQEVLCMNPHLKNTYTNPNRSWLDWNHIKALWTWREIVLHLRFSECSVFICEDFKIKAFKIFFKIINKRKKNIHIPFRGTLLAKYSRQSMKTKPVLFSHYSSWCRPPFPHQSPTYSARRLEKSPTGIMSLFIVIVTV